MLHKKIIFSFLLFLFLCINATSNEIDYYSPENLLSFADHLYEQGDYIRSAKEYERYMLCSPSESDKALYKIGLCFRYSDEIDKAINAFQRITIEYPNSNFKFPANFQIGYSYFVSGQHEKSKSFAFGLLKDGLTIDQQKKLCILLALNHIKQGEWQQANSILNATPDQLSEDQNVDKILFDLKRLSFEGTNRKQKSRFWASFMSAIIPGTGKVYCGQYGNGIYSFITVSSVGFLAYSGFKENGIKSIKGWAFGGLFTIFYFGNIYGSGISALAYNDYVENEIIIRLPLLPDDW